MKLPPLLLQLLFLACFQLHDIWGYNIRGKVKGSDQETKRELEDATLTRKPPTESKKETLRLTSPTQPNPTPDPTPEPTPDILDCGCPETCTSDVLERMAATFTCRARIVWVVGSGQSEIQACQTISDQFPDACGQGCDPRSCKVSDTTPNPSPAPTPAPTPLPTPEPTTSSFYPEQQEGDDVLDCGCQTCTYNVLDQMAGGYSCRDRIEWVMANMGETETQACQRVSLEFPEICGQGCSPNSCNLPDPTPNPTPVPLSLIHI